MTARSEISKRYGQHYSEKFLLFDINGITRLSLPSAMLKPVNSVVSLKYSSQGYTMEYYNKKLAEHIWVSNNIYNKDKSHYCNNNCFFRK